MLPDTITSPNPEVPTLPPPLSTLHFPGSRRRNGKVARLSKELRDLVNTMLQDGHTYAEIMDKLADRGVSVNHENISNWKDGGYQDWLNEQAWRETMLLRHESFTDILTGADPVKLPEAGLQIAVLGLCEQLRSLSEPGTDTDPDGYVRVANSLARLSRSILQLQQYRDAAAKAKSAELKRRDPTKPGTEKEKQLLIDNWTAFFGHDFGPGGFQPEHEPGRVGSPEPTALAGRLASPQTTALETDRLASPQTTLFETATSARSQEAEENPEHPEPPPTSSEAATVGTGDPTLPESETVASPQPTVQPLPPDDTHCHECGEFIGRPTWSGYRPIKVCPRCRTWIPDA